MQQISPPHLHDRSSVQGMMLQVAVALAPGLVCYCWFFGPGVLIHCLLAVSYAMLIEWLLHRIFRRQTRFVVDGSVVVTALLFALTITPLATWWINLTGILFAVVIAKHLYGGLGYNLFNPAMAGYVFILLCFPLQLNSWLPVTDGAQAPGFADYIHIIFSTQPVDALSGASPLNYMKSQLDSMAIVPEITGNPIYGSLAGRGWEFINAGFLAGGVWLLLTRVVNWQIPAGMLAGLFACSLVFFMNDSDIAVNPVFYLFSGGTMLCAFFIATDPVTAPSSGRGRFVYGLCIGTLTFVIRKWGGYPDGLAFSVLTANMFAPLINHMLRPRVLGENKSHD